MKREDIIRMAREAGLVKVKDCCGVPNKFCASDEWKGNLNVFAALVAAAAKAEEREACAKVCEDAGYKYRERASRLDPENRDIDPKVAVIANMTCDFNAAAIRASGQA